MNIAGNLLIAPPSVKGNFWYKTVILVTEDHASGSMGLVLNKRSQMTISDFGEQIGIPIDQPGFIYLGGPVNVKSLSFLHSPEWSCDNTMPINSFLSLSSSEDVLNRISDGDTPMYWRLFLGVCGWGPNQLASEIKGTPPRDQNTSWCTAKSATDLIFEHDLKDQWIQALEKSGQEFAQNMLA